MGAYIHIELCQLGPLNKCELSVVPVVGKILCQAVAGTRVEDAGSISFL